MRAWNVRALQFALVCSSPFLLFSQNTDKAAVAAALPAYGGCPAPSHEGVTLCAPYNGASIDGPFQVIASATSSRAQVSHMELWADGKKVTQAPGTPFDEPITLSSGTHRLTLIEVAVTGSFVKSKPFQVTVEANHNETCSAPGAAGVNLCEPVASNCHTSAWVTVLAAGKGANGPVGRMELWVNGGKIANFPGNRINTHLFIQDFSTVSVYEVDSKGAVIKSAPIVVQSC